MTATMPTVGASDRPADSPPGTPSASDRRLRQLNAVSITRAIDPAVSPELAGHLSDGQVLPDDLLSVAGLDLAMTDEQRVRLSREEVASCLLGGIEFEAVLMAGFGLELATRSDLRDPRATYALHEIGEETRHSRIFIELVQELDDAVTEAATAAATEGVRAAIVAGALACIEFMDRVDYRQIVVVDGPAVLGLDRWHQIDGEAGLHTMEQALELLAAEGHLEVPVNSALVRALFGALTELSLAHARGELTTADAIGAFELVLDRLGPNVSPTASSSTKRKTAVQ